ncbi:MAG: hypothetical protein Q9203_007469 [Teloschistes exilis]
MALNAQPNWLPPAHMAPIMDFVSKPPIELYHGYPDEDISRWLISFEQLARLSRWDNQFMVDMCSLCLRGKAQEYFWSMRSRGVADYATVKHEMTARFGEIEMQLIAKLETRKQGISESVSDYADDMRRMFGKVQYPDVAQVHRFMHNLNDKYRDKVIDRMPRTLDEAIDSAIWFEDCAAGVLPNSNTSTFTPRDDASKSSIGPALDKYAAAQHQDVDKLTDKVKPVIASQTVQPRARTKATVLAAQRARREYSESRAAETLPTPGVTAFSSPENGTAVPPAQHADASYAALATVPDRLETPLLDTEITPENRSTADADLTDLQALPSKVDLTSGTSDSSVDALPIVVADPAELLPEGADEPVHMSITDRQAALLGLAVTVYKADSCTTILAQKLGELLMPLSVPADSKPEASESPLAECDTECPPLPDTVSTDDSLGYAAEQPPKPPDPPEPTSPCVESVSMGTAVRQLTAENTIAMQNNLPDLLPAATNAAALLADAAVAHLPCMPACAAEQTSTNVVPVTAKPMETPSYVQPDTDRFFVRPEPILVSSILP